MDVKRFEEFDERCSEIYDNGGLEEAIKFLNGNRNNFEGYLRGLIDCDIAIYSMRIGDKDRTLKVLNGYLEEGIWFNENFLKEILCKEEFKMYASKMRETCRKQMEKVTAKTYIELPTNFNKEKKYPLFIALHNSNGDVEFFREYWKSRKLKEEYIVLMPQSSQLFSSSSYCWDDKNKAYGEIKAMYEKLIDEFNIDTEHIIIGGFSQGAQVALDIALNKNIIPVSGFIVLNTPKADVEADTLQNACTRGIRGIVIAGENDKFFEDQRKMITSFNEVGLVSKFNVIKNLGHWFPNDLSEQIDSSLEFVISK
ncbi:hypothetical protein [Anaerosporobacter sp.]